MQVHPKAKNKKKCWAECMGVSCKCIPSEKGVTFLLCGGECGVEFRGFRGYFIESDKDDE